MEMNLQFLNRITSKQRTHQANIQLGAYMAFVAGAVNAGGFLALQRYTSHMTGIVAAIGDDLALNNYRSVFVGLFLLVAFLFGSATTAILVNWGKRRKIHSQYALPLMLEAFILLVFGLVGANINLYVPITIPTLGLLLCFVMGLQNAIVTKASHAEIRTTHMTGVITDIGIELGKLVYWNGEKQSNPRDFVRADREKLKELMALFGMFLVGGIIGAISFKNLGYISVLPLSLSLFGIAGLQIYRDLKSIMKKMNVRTHPFP
jgi:uncharacterized membrane protein YoaK (UPF0700 family)